MRPFNFFHALRAGAGAGRRSSLSRATPWRSSASPWRWPARINSLSVCMASAWRWPAASRRWSAASDLYPHRTCARGQKLLTLLPLRRLLGPIDDVGMPWRIVVAVDAKAGIAHRCLVEFTPTVEALGRGVSRNNVVADMANSGIDEPVHVKYGKLEFPVWLKRLRFHGRSCQTAALQRKSCQQSGSPDRHVLSGFPRRSKQQLTNCGNTPCQGSRPFTLAPRNRPEKAISFEGRTLTVSILFLSTTQSKSTSPCGVTSTSGASPYMT